jgi:SET domain-containing protein
MLKVATIIKPSPIHGFGCFAGEEIKLGQLVWEKGVVDEECRNCLAMKIWEHHHAYRSKAEKELWILPRDNAAWINFAAAGEEPNLVEVFPLFGEPDLVAARDIKAGEELTVGAETDGDSEWKIRNGRIERSPA